MLYVYFYMRNIRKFIINRIFALYITHRAVIQAGVCGFILHTPAYFFMEHDKIVYTKGGNSVLTYAQVEKLREQETSLNIIAQRVARKSSWQPMRTLPFLAGTVAEENRGHCLWRC